MAKYSMGRERDRKKGHGDIRIQISLLGPKKTTGLTGGGTLPAAQSDEESLSRNGGRNLGMS